jgi:hypothetical protein
MKLKFFFMIIVTALLASCGSGGSDTSGTGSSTVTSTTTSNVSLSNIKMSVDAKGLNGNKTRVSVLMTVKNTVNFGIQAGSVVGLGGADSIHVMAYGTEKTAEKFVHPSGAFEYRAEFDTNTTNMPIEVWYAPEVGSRLDIGRVESLGRALPYTSEYANNTVSVVFDTTTFPASFFSPFSTESLACEQGGDGYLHIPYIENSIVNNAYVHSSTDLFGNYLTSNGISISNCTFDLSINYFEEGLGFDNNSLLWGGGTFESGDIVSGQQVELKFSNL